MAACRADTQRQPSMRTDRRTMVFIISLIDRKWRFWKDPVSICRYGASLIFLALMYPADKLLTATRMKIVAIWRWYPELRMGFSPPAQRYFIKWGSAKPNYCILAPDFSISTQAIAKSLFQRLIKAWSSGSSSFRSEIFTNFDSGTEASNFGPCSQCLIGGLIINTNPQSLKACVNQWSSGCQRIDRIRSGGLRIWGRQIQNYFDLGACWGSDLK